MTTLPVLAGVAMRALLPALARRLEHPLQNIAVLFWALLLVALIAAN